MFKLVKLFTPLLMLLLMVGCTDDFAGPDSNSGENVEARANDSEKNLVGLDAQLVEVGREVPGFGGMFYDDDGHLNVYMKQEDAAGKSLAEQRTEVRRALTNVFGDDIFSRGSAGPERSANGAQNRAPQSEITILEGQYDVRELAQWRDALADVLGMQGVVTLDLAEDKNRVRIGVASGSASAEVLSAAVDRRVPQEAVLIEETEPVELAATLRSRIRPARGGLQINFGGSLCTMGFNAYRGSTRGFVTNSHCTNVQGGTEGTLYNQPSGSSSRIGREYRDPFYFTGGSCPSGRRCRYSDTAFGYYYGSASSDLGRLARVTGNGTTGGASGSMTIDDAKPTYRIVSETSFPTSGEWLDKIGRTTGHTYGRVGGTCVNTNVNGTNITMLCQDFVDNAGVNNGDSGSPVFKWSYGGDVSLYGILWGGSGSSFVFSALDMTQRSSEMGDLRTF